MVARLLQLRVIGFGLLRDGDVGFATVSEDPAQPAPILHSGIVQLPTAIRSFRTFRAVWSIVGQFSKLYMHNSSGRWRSLTIAVLLPFDRNTPTASRPCSELQSQPYPA